MKCEETADLKRKLSSGGVLRALPGRRSSFTLIELMVVVVIIGILAGLVSAAVTKLRKYAVEKRIKSEKQTIVSAIKSYYHEYGYFPSDPDAGEGTNIFVISNYNYQVMACLKKEGNLKQIQFINLSEYRTNYQGSVLCPTSGFPYIIRMNMGNMVVEVIEATDEDSGEQT